MKKFLPLVALIIVAVSIVAAFLCSMGLDKGAELSGAEAEAFASARIAALANSVGSSGTDLKITKEEFDSLHSIAKRIDSNADWFDGYYGFKMAVQESANKIILTVSNDNRCAVIEVSKDKKKALGYRFEEKKCNGSWVLIEGRK